ncbi:M20 family metallo-hydrolase [Desulfovibrio sp. OttesenSCG-928-A18]|nr:M20 family metallo-hydrolase [Desulfovibrio sp. OttesenSCG-928-A18]
MLSALLSHLEQQRDTVIRWQREMTARPALGPDNKGAGEEAKAAWLREELRALGLSDISRHDSPDERVPCGFRPNISARVPGKKRETLWIIAHMDVVPPGDDKLWHSPPHELRVDGDFLYGRGVEDNQQGMVTAMLAAEALVSRAVTPDTGLGLLFVADEETGMRHGLPYVLAKFPELISDQDLLLVPDMGNQDGSMVEVAEKGCLWLRFTVSGKQCHASTPDKGVNSLVGASACVLELESLYRIFRDKDPLFSPSWSTFVPSKKEANVENINTLPGRDVFYLDCRVLPRYHLDDVEREIRAVADATAARYGVGIEVEVVHREDAPEPTPLDAPVVRRLTRALREQRGIEPRICGVGGQTVAACLRHKKLPVAVWSTLMPNAHTPNERSRVSATIADARTVLAMLFA